MNGATFKRSWPVMRQFRFPAIRGKLTCLPGVDCRHTPFDGAGATLLREGREGEGAGSEGGRRTRRDKRGPRIDSKPKRLSSPFRIAAPPLSGLNVWRGATHDLCVRSPSSGLARYNSGIKEAGREVIGADVADRSRAGSERGPSAGAGASSLEVAATSRAGAVLFVSGADADRGVWEALGEDGSALA